MKRSEALVKLKIILEGQPLDSQWLYKILDAVEKIGMLPPVHYPYSCGCSIRSTCPACTPNDYKMYNKWETENE